MPDPYEAGPPECQSDEEPTADDRALHGAAPAYELSGLDFIKEQQSEPQP